MITKIMMLSKIGSAQIVMILKVLMMAANAAHHYLLRSTVKFTDRVLLSAGVFIASSYSLTYSCSEARSLSKGEIEGYKLQCMEKHKCKGIYNFAIHAIV
jgi:hypothetical protein